MGMVEMEETEKITNFALKSLSNYKKIKMMKIAIPSNDNVTISKHFGKTKGFVICETQDNKLVKKEYKQNTFTGHAQGLHSADSHEHKHEHHHEHKHGHGHHSHNAILEAIGDCEVVIAGGMGRRLYNDLEQNDIKVFVSTEENIDKALDMFFNGDLDNNTDTCCNH